jgi:hypothetical protein
MKNYVTYEEFLPVLKSSRTLTVTTEYNRPDTQTPFVNSAVLHRLEEEGRIRDTKVGPGKHLVELVR